jgi:hypothetical protein
MSFVPTLWPAPESNGGPPASVYNYVCTVTSIRGAGTHRALRAAIFFNRTRTLGEKRVHRWTERATRACAGGPSGCEAEWRTTGVTSVRSSARAGMHRGSASWLGGGRNEGEGREENRWHRCRRQTYNVGHPHPTII